MLKQKNFARLLILGFVVSTVFSALNVVLAGNPASPISPSDNILDPGDPDTDWGGCGPEDSNCYVSTPWTLGDDGNISELLMESDGIINWNDGEVTLENDSATLIFAGENFIIDGNMGIGTYEPDYKLTVEDTNASITGFNIERNGQFTYTINPSGDQGLGARSFSLEGYAVIPQESTNVVGNIVGVNSSVENYGSGDIDVMDGFEGWAYNTTDVSISSLRGGWIGVESDDGTLNQVSGLNIWSGIYGGTVTNHYGIRIEDLENSGGTVTNRYGIHIPAFTGSATNDYGIYQAGSSQKNYFEGKVGLGTNDPTSSLFIDASGANTNPLTIKTNGSAGNYTPTNSGIFIKDASGGEVLRIFASDPDDANYNSGNLFIGFEAGHDNPTDNVSAGYYNTAIGFDTLYSNTTGFQNTALGTFALVDKTLGDNNTAIGYGAGMRVTTGTGNVILGASSSGPSTNQITSGSNNISIGTNVAVPTATADNQLVIANLIYGTGLDGHDTTISTGSIGIADKSPDATLDVHGTVCLDLNADDACTDNTAAISDVRTKTNVTDLEDSMGYINNLRPVRFTWNGEYNTGHADSLGFIAQDVQEIFPELVIEDINGYKNLDYSKLTAVLAKGAQELDARVIGLEEMTNESFLNKIISWFGDIENGVTDFFAGRIHTEEICVGENGDETCLNKSQIDEIFQNTNVNTNDDEQEPQNDNEEPEPEKEGGEAVPGEPVTEEPDPTTNEDVDEIIEEVVEEVNSPTPEEEITAEGGTPPEAVAPNETE